ncbi:benzoate/H(+) symporter BenE family transporter [Alisedimentitalea sp. MJ-SS2]|uniref:benzoate/H(+) symporter BenE family transporter n=1 Tax=Aliisedimentitalea sp. MJ-SS2 TaxID=3049795 RepID=UPI0029102E9B|nr:benzoate/H(+) symporter BenE family transporter [Alisedimentitalea sp. MJ-SS2]MDU8928691.1 benzoate/H(+) symporter BenE family transporter [Alisedimentitalea sp. MJ-SS2]
MPVWLDRSTFLTGLVVAVVGFFSSFPILLQGINQMGASPSQAASALMAAALAMGLAGIGLSLWQRMPISVAWSTPGAALLAVTAPDAAGFAGAVAAFLVAGLLTMIAGLWKPLTRATTMVPAPVAHAMLAGILLSICARPVLAAVEIPQYALPIIATWFIVSRFNRLFATPAAVLVMGAVIIWANGGTWPLPDYVLTAPEFVAPVFSWGGVMGIALPLFVVTMATQNVPGIAVLRAERYDPSPGPSIAAVGGFSVLSAPFGAPATCLAAITAAMCASPDAHPDPEQRYLAAVWAGLFYCLFGIFAGVITAFTAVAPAMVLPTLAGVALFGVFVGSASAAMADPSGREAAALTFVITASGVSFLGLGGAVWGLIAGSLVWMLRSRG